MKEFLVVGRPNTGKTLFTLQFASYLGAKTVDVTFKSPDGLLNCRNYDIAVAKQELCGMMQHKTRMVQSITLKMRVGKILAHFKLTDTCGLIESIHNDSEIRRGMAQTLNILRYAEFIFHIVDLAILKEHEKKPMDIDKEIHDYGVARQHYMMLANKIDLPIAKNNLKYLKTLYPNTMILPISAMYCNGFKEVKSCVARNL